MSKAGHNGRGRNWPSETREGSHQSLVNGSTWLLGLALLLALVSYWPTLHYGFVFDDVPQIVQNPAIKSWSQAPQYFTAHVGAGLFPTVRGSFYRPFFLLWLRLNYILFKVTPWGWHLTSLFANLVSISVFFLVLRQWTRDGMVAGWGAVLFAVHPIHIEAVAWISAVPEIQFAVAGLGAIYACGRFREQRRRLFLYLALALYAVAVLAKETAVVIWPLIAICDRWLDPSSRSVEPPEDQRATVKMHLAFAAITAGYFGLRLHALRGIAGDVTHTFREVLCVTPALIWFYLQHLVAPFVLSQIYYQRESSSVASPHFYIPLLAVFSIALGLTAWSLTSKPARCATLLLALSLLPPLLGVFVFPRNDLVHDRYAFLPSAGACVLVALAFEQAVFLARRYWGLKERSLGTWLVAIVAVALAISIRNQERPYHDNIALFTRAVRVSPRSAMAWGLLGEEQMMLGHYAEGITSFQRAEALDPRAVLNNYRLAAAYYFLQNMSSAEVFFQRVIDNYQDGEIVTYDYALYRLGLAQYAQGKMQQAEATLRRATEMEPDGLGYHLALGAAMKYQGKLSEAKKQFEIELTHGPNAEASTLLSQINGELIESKPR